MRVSPFLESYLTKDVYQLIMNQCDPYTRHAFIQTCSVFYSNVSKVTRRWWSIGREAPKLEFQAGFVQCPNCKDMMREGRWKRHGIIEEKNGDLTFTKCRLLNNKKTCLFCMKSFRIEKLDGHKCDSLRCLECHSIHRIGDCRFRRRPCGNHMSPIQNPACRDCGKDTSCGCANCGAYCYNCREVDCQVCLSKFRHKDGKHRCPLFIQRLQLANRFSKVGQISENLFYAGKAVILLVKDKHSIPPMTGFEYDAISVIDENDETILTYYHDKIKWQIKDVPKHCNMCATTIGAKYTCNVCKVTRYCGKDCQKKDWSDHKKRCRE